MSKEGCSDGLIIFLACGTIPLNKMRGKGK